MLVVPWAIARFPRQGVPRPGGGSRAPSGGPDPAAAAAAATAPTMLV